MSQDEKFKEMSKYELKRLIKKLDGIRGRNTELVSLYIPAGYDMSKISDFVTSEASEAENIKSKNTRKNVKAALDKIGRKVKEEPVTPENGVVFFSGNVSDTEGRPDIQLWQVIPPQPIESRRYRCDKEFVLDPLKDMVVDDRVYGLIVADKSEAAIGYLQGSSVKTAYTMDSNVPGKTRAGGQSAQRFARLRKQMLKTFLNEIGDKAKNAFLDKKRDDKLLGIVVGGPGFVKNKLVDDGYLHQDLEDEIIAEESTNYSGEDALEELVEKAEDAIEDSEAVREKQYVNEFLTNLKEENGKSEYGLKQVMKAMDMGAVETVLISEDIELFEAVYECPEGHEKRVHEEEPEISDSVECDECSEEMKLEEMHDIVDVFANKAEEMSSDIKIISTNHEEGERLMNMGGIAALMRYRIR